MNAREKATLIVGMWVDPDGTCGPRSRDCLIEHIASALTVPEGRVRDEHLVDMKVLGTLPKTAVGVSIVPGFDLSLWCPVNYSAPEEGYTYEFGSVEMFADGEYSHRSSTRNQCWDIERCYCSLPAALADKKEPA